MMYFDVLITYIMVIDGLTCPEGGSKIFTVYVGLLSRPSQGLLAITTWWSSLYLTAWREDWKMETQEQRDMPAFKLIIVEEP